LATILWRPMSIGLLLVKKIRFELVQRWLTKKKQVNDPWQNFQTGLQQKQFTKLTKNTTTPTPCC
jgi:hypothetical protein